MASSYNYTFNVFESMMRYSGEDEEGRLTTVQMVLWKKLDESSSVELVGSIECCYVHLDAAQNDVKDLSDCLGQIGVPQECHARMIAKLMQYIESEVMVVDDGRRRYESETVVMDIYEESGIEAYGVEEESIMEVFRRFLEYIPRGWYYVDLGVYESWAWPEEAEGDFERAVEILRTLERSTNVTVERSRRDDVVRQSIEEYVAKMVPASEAAIASLEKVEQEGEVAALCCMICLHQDEDESDRDEDGVEELGLFSRMPCKHEFHTMCIETWLRISSFCPLCRYTMPS